MKKTLLDIIELLKKTGKRFNENDPIMMAGALAFFTVFAIPPILIIIINVLSLFSNSQTASQEVFQQVQAFMGKEGSYLLKNIVKNYIIANQSILNRILSIGIFLFASSSFFIIIQHAINKIWNVQPKPDSGFLKVLKDRGISFVTILLMGLLILLSAIGKAFLLTITSSLEQSYAVLATGLNIIFSLILTMGLGTLGFGLIYKILPDVKIEWEVVWVGAAVTSFLFLIGKFIIHFALSNSSVQQMYGQAGTMAIFLLWVFYSSIILFFGAKITQQYALSFAENIEPKDYAVKIETREI